MFLNKGSSILEKPIIKPVIPSSLRDLEGPRPFTVFKMFKPKEKVNAENHCTKNRETGPPS
jgi:hypothetical protein